jgi:hypothetical protein
MKRSTRLAWLILLSLALVAGCTAAATPPPTNTPLPASAQPPSGTDTPAPTSTPQEPKVAFYYENSCQFELVDSAGTRVLIDVGEPRYLKSPATEKDALLTTHTYHTDHYNKAFATAFPGKQLVAAGALDLPGVAIKGIESTHSDNPNSGKMIIYIVDMGGLRIVHFGGVGQAQFTPEQLTQLGQVDVAIMQLENTASNMNLTNEKAFKLMEQVKPKLVIPTHGNVNMKIIKYAIELWKTATVSSGPVTIGRSDLASGDGTQLLVLGDLASAYKKIFSLPEWSE